jgi:uncharacterized protein YcaQ
MPQLPTFPLRAVRDLFLARQWLDRPRGRRLTGASLEAFAAATGGIQLDSINVVARAHLLTLWARFGTYDPALLDRLIYRRRVLFEYWSHAACLIARSDLAAWRRAMLDYTTTHRGWSTWLQTNHPLLAAVEAAITERGPLANGDFADDRADRGDSGWWNWKPAAHALDYLWMTGRTLVASRAAFQKRYDLAERVLPEWPTVTPLDEAAFRRWHLRRSLAAMGAATEIDLRLYLMFPRLGAAVQRERLRDALADGEVVEVAVEDSSARWFALADDLPALARLARRPAVHRGTTFLAPFDSLLWHRARTHRLFGFDYKIEVYTPAPRRRFGYYTLPILSDGRLIGRVDAKHHRDERRLALRHVAYETPLAEPDAAVTGTAGAARALAEFLGAERVTLERVTPAKQLVPLRRALRS